MDLDIVSRLLFPAPPTSYSIDSFPGELIWVPRSLNPQTSSPEDCVPCLFLRHGIADMPELGGPKHLLIYLHGNAEDIGRCYPFCRAVRDELQVHVLAVEYPTYGVCPGSRCDEKAATDCVMTAFRFVREVLRWPLDSIFVMGRSIGTGPAIALAAEHAFAGLILISPFLSVREVCRDALGPLAYLIDERFPNRDRVSYIRSACLVVHGKLDTLIPHRHGQELFEACTARKAIVLPEDMDHNANLMEKVQYFIGPMLEFFPVPDNTGPEIHVPRWAFDKRMAPLVFHTPLAAKASMFWACASCQGCQGCQGCTRESIAAEALPLVAAQKLLAHCESSENNHLSSHVEETITSAVEHVLSRNEDLVWTEADAEDQPEQPVEYPKSLRHKPPPSCCATAVCWSAPAGPNMAMEHVSENIFGHVLPDEPRLHAGAYMATGGGPSTIFVEDHNFNNLDTDDKRLAMIQALPASPGYGAGCRFRTSLLSPPMASSWLSKVPAKWRRNSVDLARI